MTEALQRLDDQGLDFSSPQVRKAVTEAVRAKAVASAPGALNRLLEIAESEDERSALTAIKLVMQLSGALVNKSQIDHRVTFDDLRKKESNDPLSSLFDVRPSVIDAEVDDVH